MRPSKMSQEIIYFSVWFFCFPMKKPAKMLSTRYTTVTAKETTVTVEIIKVILIMTIWEKNTSGKNKQPLRGYYITGKRNHSSRQAGEETSSGGFSHGERREEFRMGYSWHLEMQKYIFGLNSLKYRSYNKI